MSRPDEFREHLPESHPDVYLHAYRGAYSRRFMISRKADGELVTDAKYGGAISAHVYRSAEIAIDVAIAWLYHPHEVLR